MDDLSIIFNHQSETSIISQSSEPEYLPPTDISTALSSLDSPILWSNNPQKTWGNDHPTWGNDHHLPHSDGTLTFGTDHSFSGFKHTSPFHKRAWNELRHDSSSSPIDSSTALKGTKLFKGTSLVDNFRKPLREIQVNTFAHKRIIGGNSFADMSNISIYSNGKENLPVVYEEPEVEKQQEHFVDPSEFYTPYLPRKFPEAFTLNRVETLKTEPTAETPESIKNQVYPLNHGTQVFVFDPIHNSVGLVDLATVFQSPLTGAVPQEGIEIRTLPYGNISFHQFEPYFETPKHRFSVLPGGANPQDCATVIETALAHKDSEGSATVSVRRNCRYREGNFYTPRLIRGKGQYREGLCELCELPSWFNMKFSTYWYHMNFVHGINAKTGTYHRKPKNYRVILCIDIQDNNLVRGKLYANENMTPKDDTIRGGNMNREEILSVGKEMRSFRKENGYISRREAANAAYQGYCETCLSWIDLQYFCHDNLGTSVYPSVTSEYPDVHISCDKIMRTDRIQVIENLDPEIISTIQFYPWYKHVQKCCANNIVNNPEIFEK